MADIYNFPDNDNFCECEACQVVEEYLDIILDQDSPDVIRLLLREMYDVAERNGIKYALETDIEEKINALNYMGSEDLY